MTTLILTPRMTPDTDALATAALTRGWEVLRLSAWRVPDGIIGPWVIYGEPLFAEVVAGTLGLVLLETPPSWLPTLPWRYRKRAVTLMTVAQLPAIRGPVFIKPAAEKAFPAQVYAQGTDVPETGMLPPDMPVLVSEPVVWEVEYRCVIAARQVLTISPYWRDGRLAQAEDGTWPAQPDEYTAAQAFMQALLADPGVGVPPGCVIDIGRIADRGWAVVEANSVWGAGIYGCDPMAVLDALEQSVIPPDQVTDGVWVRPPVEVEWTEPPQPHTDTDGVLTLYRPVGERELALIAAAGYRAFPPRLPEQPIFYPVLNERYAREIAQGWNTRDAASGAVGHVTRFQVRAAALACYPSRGFTKSGEAFTKPPLLPYTHAV